MVDNPNLLPESVDSQKKLYAGFFYRRFIEGLWFLQKAQFIEIRWSEELIYDERDEHRGLLA